MPSKQSSIEKYGFNPERDTVILRLPLGLSSIDGAVHVTKLLKLLLQAVMTDIKVEDGTDCTRLLIKPIHDFDEGAKRIIATWIARLIANPDRNKAKPEIPSDHRQYSLTLYHEGVVYKDMFPISTVKDEQGYYAFRFFGFLEV